MDYRIRWLAGAALSAALAAPLMLRAQDQTAVRFGGEYRGLDARRQQLVKNWVDRFNAVTGQTIQPEPFYDELVVFSAKTTFEAVTNALMQSQLTEASSGAPLGDALSLIETVDSVHGAVPGTRGDQQFRMYAVLTPTAVDTLRRSNEFKRLGDNSVYHKGYPQNYREQGGAPSVQISVSNDRRHADVDVDYRSSSFPAALFNGHLTAANSDVRADDNYDRHINRWAGFRNWWRNFLGVGVEELPNEPDISTPLALPAVPRAGKKNIDVMVNDFLTAWLVEGNVVEAMGYVSKYAYACLASSGGPPTAVDKGMAPYRVMMNLKATHDAVGPHQSIEGLTTGVRLTRPELKVVQQAHHGQFVVYSVPDDVAAAFDCENRLVNANVRPATRKYGNYFGAIFYVQGHKDSVVALLWEKEDGYWKIVSWQTGFEVLDIPPPAAPPETKIQTVPADPVLVTAATSFLESWFVRKNYDAAFRYLSERSYACYELVRDRALPPATSTADAGRRTRAAIETVAREAGTVRRLDQLIQSVEPTHPAVRLMAHSSSGVFTLTSLPASLAAAADCATRVKNEAFAGVTELDYGSAFGMNFRFRSDNETPVLRAIWMKEDGNWRITAYDVEVP